MSQYVTLRRSYSQDEDNANNAMSINEDNDEEGLFDEPDRRLEQLIEIVELKIQEISSDQLNRYLRCLLVLENVDESEVRLTFQEISRRIQFYRSKLSISGDEETIESKSFLPIGIVDLVDVMYSIGLSYQIHGWGDAAMIRNISSLIEDMDTSRHSPQACISFLHSQSLTKLLWSLAIHNTSHSILIKALPAVSLQLHHLTGPDSFSLLWSCSRLKVTDRVLILRLMQVTNEFVLAEDISHTALDCERMAESVRYFHRLLLSTWMKVEEEGSRREEGAEEGAAAILSDTADQLSSFALSALKNRILPQLSELTLTTCIYAIKAFAPVAIRSINASSVSVADRDSDAKEEDSLETLRQASNQFLHNLNEALNSGLASPCDCCALLEAVGAGSEAGTSATYSMIFGASADGGSPNVAAVRLSSLRDMIRSKKEWHSLAGRVVAHLEGWWRDHTSSLTGVAVNSVRTAGNEEMLQWVAAAAWGLVSLGQSPSALTAIFLQQLEDFGLKHIPSLSPLTCCRLAVALGEDFGVRKSREGTKAGYWGTREVLSARRWMQPLALQSFSYLLSRSELSMDLRAKTLIAVSGLTDLSTWRPRNGDRDDDDSDYLPSREVDLSLRWVGCAPSSTLIDLLDATHRLPEGALSALVTSTIEKHLLDRDLAHDFEVEDEHLLRLLDYAAPISRDGRNEILKEKACSSILLRLRIESEQQKATRTCEGEGRKEAREMSELLIKSLKAFTERGWYSLDLATQCIQDAQHLPQDASINNSMEKDSKRLAWMERRKEFRAGYMQGLCEVYQERCLLDDRRSHHNRRWLEGLRERAKSKLSLGLRFGRRLLMKLL